jgi:hypothetical protein
VRKNNNIIILIILIIILIINNKNYTVGKEGFIAIPQIPGSFVDLEREILT